MSAASVWTSLIRCFWVLMALAFIGIARMVVGPLETIQAELIVYTIIVVILLGALGLAEPVRFEWAVASVVIIASGACALHFSLMLFQAPLSKKLGPLVAIGFLLWGIKRYFFPGLPGPLAHEPGHPLLTEAGGRAQATLERFRELVASRAGTLIVKFPYKTEDGSTEFLWAELLEWDAGSMLIRYESAPVTQSGLPGAEKRAASELVDWAVIRENGKMEGAYSQRAMLRLLREQNPHPRWGVRRRLALEESRFEEA